MENITIVLGRSETKRSLVERELRRAGIGIWKLKTKDRTISVLL